ncbi:uroporphyrinogen-III C-methyltransferase [Alteribacillus persepolensis]|uniref:Uroporphyrinogen-III C-methyltransferase n=1 Tax=Alteribacillus persepolensis TaxID=568899 RepID=A0A1G7Z518_9BACI|nr:uroporphyrinogen-III C-methyltransferase [Alteribacillus persepolensis]SDH03699.1 uroporphyrinogen-III C-methyltransferase [Alteribacillus persepolensis]
MKSGYVYITGAGPGDVKLLTVKAIEALQQSDVVIYDRLVNNDILEHVPAQAEFIYCGKLPKNHRLRQEEINQLLSDYASQGKTVTRLKGGDPFVFGRGGEEAQHLADVGIPFDVIPGISSGLAAPAYAGIPVTHRAYSSSVAMLTGHLPDEQDDKKWKALAEGIDTIIFYMGMQQIDMIARCLIDAGQSPDTPAAVIEWGTTDWQQTVTASLITLAETVHRAGLSHPAIIIVGDVVHLHEAIDWFNKEQAPARVNHET